MLSQQPAFASNFKGGLALIIGNTVGGIVAILYYELLVMVPEFGFFLLLVLLAGIAFGARVFSGKKTAPLYGMAYSTLLLVICSSTSSSSEAEAKVYTRVIQVTIAVIYVVVAFGIVNRLFKREAT